MKTALLLLLGGFLCGLHGAEGQDTPELLIMMAKLMIRVRDLETKDQAHQSEVQAFKTQDQAHQSEVQALKTQIQKLQTKDQAHQSEVQALKNQIQNLETKDQFNQSEVQSLQSEVQALKTQIQDLETKDETHQSEVQSLKTQDQALKIQMQTLENSQAKLQNSPRVAFHAGLSSGGEWSSSTSIKYDRVWTNVGGAYSNDTGKFTAPVKGLYVFTYFVNSRYTIDVKLKKNTGTVAYALDSTTNDKWDSSTGVAVVTLEAGDTVYVQLKGQINDSIHDATFSGFLLAPI